MPSLFRPRVERVTVTKREAHPIAQFMASALGALYGRGIDGKTGTFQYGAPSTASQRTKFTGYAYPAQGFVGWNPRKVAGGHLAPNPGRLPATAPQDPVDNPLQSAVATINAGAGLVY